MTENLAEQQVIDSIADVTTTFANQGCLFSGLVQTKLIRELAEEGRPSGVRGRPSSNHIVGGRSKWKYP